MEEDNGNNAVVATAPTANGDAVMEKEQPSADLETNMKDEAAAIKTETEEGANKDAVVEKEQPSANLETKNSNSNEATAIKADQEEIHPTTSTTEEKASNISNSNNKEGDNSRNERKAWDFSHRKVRVKNILKYMNPKNVKKMVDAWAVATGDKIQIVKTKKPPTDSWVVVTLEKEEQVAILVDYINSNNLTNKRGEKLVANCFDQGGGGGDDNDNDDNDNGRGNGKRGNRDDNRATTKRQRVQHAVNAKPRIVTEEEVKDAMIPLWRSTYEEQLKVKEKEMVRKCAIKVVQEIKQKFRQLEKEAKRNKHVKKVKPYPWVTEMRAIEVAPILHAKSIVRNKCEFTFGFRYLAIEDGNANAKSSTVEEDSTKDTPMDVSASTPAAIPAAEDSGEDTATKASETTTAAVSTPKVENGVTDTPMDTSETATDVTPAEDDVAIKKIPSVGGMAKGWSGGVSHPHGCRNIPSEAMVLLDIVERFLADCPMPPYNSKEHQGFWRTMMMRSSRRTKECMLVFVHAPLTGGAGSKDDVNIDNYTPEIFESEKARLISMVTGKNFPTTYPKLEEDGEVGGPESDNDKQQDFLQVTSVFFQEFDGVSMPSPDHPVQHVYGAKALKEKLGPCTFQISPGAFFQVNTETAETLYNVVVEKVREVATNPEDTLCFDVCCGTGTIGLTLMKEGVVGKVVGVDLSAPAIDDAKVNAELNGFSAESSKTRFVAARAEHVMLKELNTARASGASGKVVAVVDPAREGLHADVVKALRGFSQIERLVYVSCNPTGSLVKDAALLCTPASKRYRGRPFRVTFAQPVDMFPYSNHCEMVMVFDRLTDKELGGQPE